MTKMISRIGKLDEIKKARRVDAFLFSSSSSIKYFSGYFFYFEYGPSPFHLHPAVLMVLPGQESTLILADNEMGQSSSVDPDIKVLPYESYTYLKPPDPAAACIGIIATLFREKKIGTARIGIEENNLPWAVVKKINEIFPYIEWIDVSPDISLLKSVKDPDEIEQIRQASKLSDLGQETVLKYAKDGISELELFERVHMEMEKTAGNRIPLMSDLSSGINTNSGGGMPTNKIIQTGDLVLSDFQPCLQGYWGDSCSTIVIGKPTAEQKKTWKLVQEALEIGIHSIKPGIRAKEIDRLMRAHIGNYPHHSGHSVGTDYHEGPRITPYNDTKLIPGMIVALEPAIYKENWGIRLEHLMLVTDTGCEILTHFEHRLKK